jgi:hypothetical protein
MRGVEGGADAGRLYGNTTGAVDIDRFDGSSAT